jgi:dipeptidyl aminopeptidase/acylaminoacyl peptidase
VSFPTWSPNGQFVAFLSTFMPDVYTHYAEVWVADVAATQLFAVSEAANPGNAIAWLPIDISGREDQ